MRPTRKNKHAKHELSVLIVDDERLARIMLRQMLLLHKNIAIAGEAGNVDEADILIREKNPDVVLLDIQMPGGNGFTLLERLEAPPYIIFVTAFDHYAIRAFEVNALDYLLKPIARNRLEKALQRAVEKINLSGELVTIDSNEKKKKLTYDDQIVLKILRA